MNGLLIAHNVDFMQVFRFKQGRLMPIGSNVTSINMYKIAQDWCFRYLRWYWTTTIIQEEEKDDFKTGIVLFTLRPSSCQQWADRSSPRPWVDPFVARAVGLSVSLLEEGCTVLTVGRLTEIVPCDLAVSGAPSPCKIVRFRSEMSRNDRLFLLRHLWVEINTGAVAGRSSR
jgi:hypothetical protein